jgi:hypothetical protein
MVEDPVLLKDVEPLVIADDVAVGNGVVVTVLDIEVDLVAEPDVVPDVETVALLVVAAVAETDELPEADAVLDAVDVCVEISHPLKLPAPNSTSAEFSAPIKAAQSSASRITIAPPSTHWSRPVGPDSGP